MVATGRGVLDWRWLFASLVLVAAVAYGVLGRAIAVDGTQVVVYPKLLLGWKGVAVGAFGLFALSSALRPVRGHPVFQGLVGAIALAGGLYGVSGAGAGRTSWLIALVGAWILLRSLSAGIPDRRRPHA